MGIGHVTRNLSVVLIALLVAFLGVAVESPSAQTAPGQHHAKMKLLRADVKDGRLDMLVSVTGRATGELKLAYHANGQRRTYTPENVGARQEGEKQIRIVRRLEGAQKGGRTGIVTITYPGNEVVYPDSIRSRAANGRSRLRVDVIRILDFLRDGSQGFRMGIGGYIDDDVRGDVRLRIAYRRQDGSFAHWHHQLRIGKCDNYDPWHWCGDPEIPAEVRHDREAYLTVQFTGDFDAPGGPYRGEQFGVGLRNVDGGCWFGGSYVEARRRCMA